MHAVVTGSKAMVELLLARGADIHLVDNVSEPLEYLVTTSDPDILIEY